MSCKQQQKTVRAGGFYLHAGMSEQSNIKPERLTKTLFININEVNSLSQKPLCSVAKPPFLQPSIFQGVMVEKQSPIVHQRPQVIDQHSKVKMKSGILCRSRSIFPDHAGC